MFGYMCYLVSAILIIFNLIDLKGEITGADIGVLIAVIAVGLTLIAMNRAKRKDLDDKFSQLYKHINNKTVSKDTFDDHKDEDDKRFDTIEGYLKLLVSKLIPGAKNDEE